MFHRLTCLGLQQLTRRFLQLKLRSLSFFQQLEIYFWTRQFSTLLTLQQKQLTLKCSPICWRHLWMGISLHKDTRYFQKNSTHKKKKKKIETTLDSFQTFQQNPTHSCKHKLMCNNKSSLSTHHQLQSQVSKKKSFSCVFYLFLFSFPLYLHHFIF